MKREFVVTVQNFIGDVCDVRLMVREDRNPSSYAGPAILKAMRVLPNERPFKVMRMEEVA